MAEPITQQTLIDTLELFSKHANDEIDRGQLLNAVNYRAAQILSERHLIGFRFTKMVTGRYVARKKGPVLTPLGEKELENIRSR
jgi:hypothetical protein